jgi:hypothetical protein
MKRLSRRAILGRRTTPTRLTTSVPLQAKMTRSSARDFCSVREMLNALLIPDTIQAQSAISHKVMLWFQRAFQRCRAELETT